MATQAWNRLFEGRHLMTRDTVIREVIPLLLIHYSIAVLVLLPRTRIFRFALFPVMTWVTLSAAVTWDRSNGNPQKAYENMTLLSYAAGMWMRSTIWTLRSKPYQRKGRPSVTIPALLLNAADLLFNPRGVGWDWADEIRAPTPVFQPELPLPIYIIKTIAKWAVCMVIFDTFVYICQSFDLSTIGTPAGGTIFDPSLPPVLRYLRSSAFTIFFGLLTLSSMMTMHQAFRLIFVVFFGHKQAQWPRLFDAPLSSTSLTELWGKRWHQLFRETFLYFGGRPLAFITRSRRVGSVLGSFILSALIHYVGNLQFDTDRNILGIAIFFVMMGVGVILEGLWKKLTGHKVGGWMGWLWVAVWVVGWGNLYADATARVGYLGNEFVPESQRIGPHLVNWAVVRWASLTV